MYTYTYNGTVIRNNVGQARGTGEGRCSPGKPPSYKNGRFCVAVGIWIRLKKRIPFFFFFVTGATR